LPCSRSSELSGFVPVMIGIRGGMTIETNLTECVMKVRDGFNGMIGWVYTY
jgi:hypothetical protein